MNKTMQREYWPTDDWRIKAPQAVGMQPEILKRMQEHISELLPGLHSLLIVRHGYLAFEEYYHDFHRGSYHSISSATKSIMSALVGVALNQGLLKSVDQHILDFFPELSSTETDPRKQAITLHHLLSFQTGFSRDYPHEFWRNPVLSALQRPMERQPGETFFYDNLSVDIFSGIISRVTGMKAAAFADITLFKTLGIWQDGAAHFAWKKETTGPHSWHEDGLWDEQDGYPWKVMRQGYNTGSFGAHFTACEMAKIGYLYLNNGLWENQQVIPASFVEASTHKQSEGGPPVYAQYGYLWWIEQQRGYDTFFASGFGGKLIYVIPDVDIVVVTTASTEQARKDSEQWIKIKNLVPDYVLPACE